MNCIASSVSADLSFAYIFNCGSPAESLMNDVQLTPEP